MRNFSIFRFRVVFGSFSQLKAFLSVQRVVKAGGMKERARAVVYGTCTHSSCAHLTHLFVAGAYIVPPVRRSCVQIISLFSKRWRGNSLSNSFSLHDEHGEGCRASLLAFGSLSTASDHAKSEEWSRRATKRATDGTGSQFAKFSYGNEWQSNTISRREIPTGENVAAFPRKMANNGTYGLRDGHLASGSG